MEKLIKAPKLGSFLNSGYYEMREIPKVGDIYCNINYGAGVIILEVKKYSFTIGLGVTYQKVGYPQDPIVCCIYRFLRSHYSYVPKNMSLKEYKLLMIDTLKKQGKKLDYDALTKNL